MKPRYEEVSTEVVAMLEKAQYLLAKAEKLDMVEHEGKKIPAFAADGKGAKDEKKKADKCPSCGGKMDMEKGMCMKMGCMTKYGTMEKASMAEKDKYCMKNFGKKYSDCSAKQKAQCDKAHGKVKKAVQPNYESQASFKPAGFHFVSETGGQTKSAGYYTNQQTLEVDDVANKGAISSSFNVEELAKRMNAHQTGIQDRDVSTDNKQPDRD